MYCTHQDRNHCFLLCPSWSLYLNHSRPRAVCISHNILQNNFKKKEKLAFNNCTVEPCISVSSDTDRMSCYWYGLNTKTVSCQQRDSCQALYCFQIIRNSDNGSYCSMNKRRFSLKVNYSF